MSRSLEFYCNKLGFKIVRDSVLRGKHIEFVTNGIFQSMRVVFIRPSIAGPTIELMQGIGEEESSEIVNETLPFPGAISILVDDLDHHVSTVLARGLAPVSEIFPVTDGEMRESRIVFYRDPDQHMIEFVELVRNSL